MEFFADEFEAAGLVGGIEGKCEADPFGDGLVLVSVDWSQAVFCRACDPTGELVRLCCHQKREIEDALRESLAEIDPAGHNGVVWLGGSLVG